MRALSLKQPFAWMVVHGGKSIENRPWHVSLRAPFLIHAASGMSPKYYLEAATYAAARGVIVPPPSDLLFGGVIGKARIVECMCPGLLIVAAPADTDLKWWMRDQHGFVLADIEPVPFFKVPGRQRWFDVPWAPAAAAKAPTPTERP